YTFARRVSTLDHLSGGRIGWNIVTGYLDSAARNLGLSRQLGHDERYDLADEYMAVVYKLWERSWEDGAVRRDKDKGVY
ncbi:LLM class flavin-dependent oxidoreductase, partial [Acinetobacter baumannii]|nr:LLM class flavin-dependent oxidoreductase [Acinetobacter baumannii]